MDESDRARRKPPNLQERHASATNRDSLRGDILRLWDERAATYEQEHKRPDSAMEYVETRRKEIVLPWLTEHMGRSPVILDASCGVGLWFEYLGSGTLTYGSDLSEPMIRECRKKNFVRTCVASFEDLPYRQDTFDLVLCLASLLYSGRLSAVLGEIHRVLKPGGVVAFSTWNRGHPRHLAEKLLRALGSRQAVIAHRYSVPYVKATVTQAGFRLKHLDMVNLLPWVIDGRTRRRRALAMLGSMEKTLARLRAEWLFNETVFLATK